MQPFLIGWLLFCVTSEIWLASARLLNTRSPVDPGSFPAQYALGYLEFQAGDNSGAERAIQVDHRGRSEKPQAWLSLAATLGAQSRFPEAQEAVAHRAAA